MTGGHRADGAGPPPTRARLLSLLSEACELEHALACSYLYAAFSIRRDIADDVDWADQQRNRRWASQIYHVAAQEMLHLGQAWNLLAAAGGTPYYARPNFPLAARHYPLSVALVLRRLDLATMERFMYYEHPAHNVPGATSPPLPPAAAWPIDESFPYTSVGELYGEVRRVIEELDGDDLFVSDPGGQVGRELVDFPDLLRVVDTRSALEAIRRITLQGEGTVEDREDSHFGVYRGICAELRALPPGHDPAHPVADNPYVRRRRDQIPAALFEDEGGDVQATEITDPVAVLALDLFDDVYVSMLQALAYVFTNSGTDSPLLAGAARAALELMATVVKPLGEAICLLPSGQPGLNAGPTFAMSRHTYLPAPGAVSRIVYGERLAELAGHADRLVGEAGAAPWPARAQLRGAAANLERISRWFDPSVTDPGRPLVAHPPSGG